jgi:hypothetical protein
MVISIPGVKPWSYSCLLFYCAVIIHVVCSVKKFLLFLSGLLQIQYRKDHDNKSQIVSVKTVSAVSSSMQLSEIAVNNSTTFYNVSVPLALLKMDSYKKVLSAVNASFHRKYTEITQLRSAV